MKKLLTYPRKEEKPALQLTPDQAFASIASGINRVRPVLDEDGVELGIFLLVDSNGFMGAGDEMPFDLPGHMAYVQQVAKKRVVVVGRNTFEKVYGGKSVPGSLATIVLSTTLVAPEDEQVLVAKHPRDVIRMTKALGEKKAWVIGGAGTFDSMLGWSDIILIDHVDKACKHPSHPYPQAKALTVYGDGMVWPNTAKTERGVTHVVSEYHRRDADGRARDARCEACPFTMGCNGWEFSPMCLLTVQERK